MSRWIDLRRLHGTNLCSRGWWSEIWAHGKIETAYVSKISIRVVLSSPINQTSFLLVCFDKTFLYLNFFLTQYWKCFLNSKCLYAFGIM